MCSRLKDEGVLLILFIYSFILYHFYASGRPALGSRSCSAFNLFLLLQTYRIQPLAHCLYHLLSVYFCICISFKCCYIHLNTDKIGECWVNFSSLYFIIRDCSVRLERWSQISTRWCINYYKVFGVTQRIFGGMSRHLTWRLRFFSATPKDKGQLGLVTCGKHSED